MNQDLASDGSRTAAIGADKWRDVAAFLASGAAFPEASPPEVIETHVSRVYMGRDLVIKLKKPTHYDFLNYATVADRHRACDAEVRLNRRLAPDVYLGAKAVTRDAQGHMALDGGGAPLEWVVLMRRLPHDKMLDVLLTAGKTVSEAELTRVLCRFYRQAPRADITPEAYVRRLAEHVRANRGELLRPEHALPEGIVKRLHSRQLQFAVLEAPLLKARVEEGRVIDGHGDLRAEHICMESEPVIYDCLEFNDELRQLDAADELCFLAMDLERLGANDLAATILSAYTTDTGDDPPRRLLDFYKSYRACVRAKVSALRSVQLTAKDADPEARLANAYLRYADRAFGWSSQPICVLVRGLVGSGKSTIASAVAAELGMEVLQTDKLRRDLFAVNGQHAAYGVGRYSADSKGAVYERMFEKASALLSQRISVVLDGCFLSHAAQSQVQALTQALGVPLLVVKCHCPDAVAAERIVQRAKDPSCLSEARPEHIAAQKLQDEGDLLEVSPEASLITIDTAHGTTAEHVRKVVEQLRRQILARKY